MSDIFSYYYFMYLVLFFKVRADGAVKLAETKSKFSVQSNTSPSVCSLSLFLFRSTFLGQKKMEPKITIRGEKHET